MVHVNASSAAPVSLHYLTDSCGGFFSDSTELPIVLSDVMFVVERPPVRRDRERRAQHHALLRGVGVQRPPHV